MKMLIQEVKEESGSVYQLFAEVSECPNPSGYKQLEFSSLWTGAKDPELPLNKGRLFLSPEGYDNLKVLLEQA
jgi:hypothetical protein